MVLMFFLLLFAFICSFFHSSESKLGFLKNILKENRTFLGIVNYTAILSYDMPWSMKEIYGMDNQKRKRKKDWKQKFRTITFQISWVSETSMKYFNQRRYPDSITKLQLKFK